MGDEPYVTFYNGRKLPMFGLGTWLATEGLQDAVRFALDIGYRHIDTATLYGNEAEIGEVLQEYMKAGKLRRTDFYVTSKLWVTHHQRERVMTALNKTLADLQLDYVDLYLIHTPYACEDTGRGGIIPTRVDGSIAFLNIPIENTWLGMEDAVRCGKAKSIGVSNFNSDQVERICKIAKIQPVTNQVECHAYLNQAKLQKFCEARNIVITSFGPLGSPGRPDFFRNIDEPLLLEDPVIKEIAEKHRKNPSQILLRFLIQCNIIVIPKSIRKERILENRQVFDFLLSDDDMKRIERLNRDYRYFVLNPFKGHPEYPFDAAF